MNKTLVVAVVALVVSVSSLLFPRTVEKVVETVTLGGSGSGQDVSFPQTFSAGMILGGVHSTSTNGSMTLPVTAIDDESVVVVLPQAATTLTLPSSSALTAIIPRVGMSKTFYLNNRSTTTNAITIVGSTGTTLKKASTTAVMNANTNGANIAEITLTRIGASSVAASVEPFGD